MRNRIERLRLWLLAGAGLLVIVLAMFIGSARYLSHHFRLGKLANLAANIKGSSSDVTYTHTSKGGTEYTIHAAREVDYKDGKIALHEVTMTLYGQRHDRADRIYGHEFEYDQTAGVVRAIGLVHIDMQAADAADAVKPHGKAASDSKVMHATTSGLIYLEKLGVAATSEKIDFQLGGMTGHAIGADYNTDTGLLLLHSEVGVNGIERDKLVSLQASSAELDNRNQRAVLAHARFVSEEKTASADAATLHTRTDGSLARIEAQGNVAVESNGARIFSVRADVALNAQNKPESAVLLGGVNYSNDEPLRQVRGQAQNSTIAFDAQGQPRNAVFTGAVHLSERTRASEAGKGPWSVNDLTGAKVDVALVSANGAPAQMRDAEASGAAHLTILTAPKILNGAASASESRTEVSADDLKAHFINAASPVDAAGAKQPPQIATLVGRGHTVLHSVSADAVEQTSAGDVLDARFRPVAPAGIASLASGSKGEQRMERLLSAVQQGHITLTRRAPAYTGAKAGSTASAREDVQHATAGKASYDGDLDRLTLTGSVQLTDAGSVLWAEQVGLDHKTGDARAEGAVKVDYVQDDRGANVAQQAEGLTRKGSHEPAHVVADRAEMEHTMQIAKFYGKPARLWQGGSQVQAPVLEFSRAQSRLIAHGSLAGGDAQVHTVLVTTGGSGQLVKTNKNQPASRAGAPGLPAQTVRVASNELIYLQTSHAAEFTGGVRVESVDGTMLAQEATAYLQSAGSLQAASNELDSAIATSGLLLGPLDHIIATGHIQIAQPGRRATGERLVYTAIDRSFLLSGDAGLQARIVDAQGTSTGAAFRFHATDDSAEALGAVPDQPTAGQRIHTEGRVGKDERSKSSKP